MAAGLTNARSLLQRCRCAVCMFTLAKYPNFYGMEDAHWYFAIAKRRRGWTAMFSIDIGSGRVTGRPITCLASKVCWVRPCRRGSVTCWCLANCFKEATCRSYQMERAWPRLRPRTLAAHGIQKMLSKCRPESVDVLARISPSRPKNTAIAGASCVISTDFMAPIFWGRSKSVPKQPACCPERGCGSSAEQVYRKQVFARGDE